MSNRKYRPVEFKVQITLRYIVRFTEDMFVAECIDAGAVGQGETQDAALRSMIDSLEALYKSAGTEMKIPASEEDEAMYAKFGGHGAVNDPEVIAWGVAQRREIRTTAGARKMRRSVEPHFAVTTLNAAA